MAIERIATITSYGGAGTAVVSGGTALVFGLTAVQWSVIGVIGGLVIGLLGFGFNAWIALRRLRLDTERKQVTST